MDIGTPVWIFILSAAAVWELAGVIASRLGYRRTLPTLSRVWWRFVDNSPAALTFPAHVALGALFVWLIGGHWLFTGLNEPGADPRDILTVGGGAVLGAVSWWFRRRRSTLRAEL